MEKTLGRHSPPLALTSVKKNKQPNKNQTTTNTEQNTHTGREKERERERLRYKIKTREVSKLSQITQLDISRCPAGTLCQPHCDGYGRMEVLLLDSARIHSSVCFNSLRTNFSRSLLDFNSSSRHCFILLFSYDGKRLVGYQTKGRHLRAPPAQSLGSLHH